MGEFRTKLAPTFPNERTRDLPSTAERVRAAMLAAGGTSTIRQLREATGLSDYAIRLALSELMGRGELQVNGPTWEESRRAGRAPNRLQLFPREGQS